MAYYIMLQNSPPLPLPRRLTHKTPRIWQLPKAPEWKPHGKDATATLPGNTALSPISLLQINWPPFLEDNLHIPSSDDHHLKIPRSRLAQGLFDVIAVEYPNHLTQGTVRERQGSRRSGNEDSLGHTRRADHYWASLGWEGWEWYYHCEIIGWRPLL